MHGKLEIKRAGRPIHQEVDQRSNTGQDSKCKRIEQWQHKETFAAASVIRLKNVSDVLYVFDGFVCAVGRETRQITYQQSVLQIRNRCRCLQGCGAVEPFVAARVHGKRLTGAMDSTAGKDHVRARWARGHFRDHRERTSLVSDRCGLRFEFIDSDSRMMVSLEKMGVAPTPSELD